MAQIRKYWEGRIYGDDSGKLFLELESTKTGEIEGTLYFTHDVCGLVTYELKGNFDDTALRLEGNPKHIPANVEAFPVRANAKLTSEGSFRGEWHVSSGSTGTFEIFPFKPSAAELSRQSAGTFPNQLHTTRRVVGVVSLFAEDIRELFQEAQKELAPSFLIVTYNASGIEETGYFEDFERETKNSGKLQYLKLFIQEPKVRGLSRIVDISFDPQGSNCLMVQGNLESWVLGTTENLERQLRRLERPMVTIIKKYGIGLNQLIFIVMFLIFHRTESTLPKLLSLSICIFSIVFISISQWNIPNAIIDMSPKKPRWIALVGPVIDSILLTVAVVLACACIYIYSLPA